MVMKLRLLFCWVFTFHFLASIMAQITLEPEHLPQLGDIIELTEVVYQGLEEGPSGENIWWDFANLTDLESTDVAYTDVSAYPEAAEYSNCESVYTSKVYDLIGILMETVSAGLGDPEGRIFLNDQYAGHLFIEGLVTGSDVPGSPLAYFNANVDVPIIHLSHLDYGETLSGTSVAFVNATINGFTGVAKLTVDRSVEADAWGTVETPTGCFEVIRHKEITEASAKVGIMVFGDWQEWPDIVPDTTAYQETYYYMSKEMRHPVLTVRKSLFPISVQYVAYASDANFEYAVGIEEEFRPEHVHVYPNPTSDRIYLGNRENLLDIEIYNIQNQTLVKQSIFNESIDVSSLENGLYFLRAIDQNEKQYYSQFVKQ